MLVHGLNDTEPALHDIATVLQRIQPDEVHLNLPTRPPAETWVQPPDEVALLRARAILGDVAWVVHPAEGEFDLSGHTDLLEAIVAVITRHPMRDAELRQALAKWTPGQVDEALVQLAASGQAQVVERYGARFWSAACSRYSGESESMRASPARRAKAR
jgi:wyosine [tRNA(Phe)-imidazoG37] synthetase (radical SAM superfamily)